MSVAAAFIQKHDYYGQAGWKADVLVDEEKYAVETYEAPKTVESACTAIWKGSRLMTPIGGGVHIEPLEAIQTSHLLKDEQGAVKDARAKVKLDESRQGPVVVGLVLDCGDSSPLSEWARRLGRRFPFLGRANAEVRISKAGTSPPHSKSL